MRHAAGGRRATALTGSRGESCPHLKALLTACVLLLAACENGGTQAVMPPSPSGGSMAPAKTGVSVALAEVVYQGGLKPGWVDAGWGDREVKGQGPAKVKMAELGGWALRHASPLKPGYGGLAFRYKAPSDFGEFLEVRLDSSEEATFPRVKVSSRHMMGMDGEWTQLLIPMAELNPDRKPFDRFIVRAHKRVDTGWVELDRIGFTLPGVSLSEEAPQEASMQLLEMAFDHGLKTGWTAEGWSERQVESMSPAKVMMADLGGWTLRRQQPLEGRFGGLAFRYQAPSNYGDFLEVRVDNGDKAVFPRVRVSAQHLAGRDGDWVQVLLPMGELNPKGNPFDRVIMRAHKRVGTEWVQLDRIGFTSMMAAETGMPAAGMARVAVGPPRPANLSVDCTGPGQSISPQIYGIAFDALKEGRSTHQFELGATVRRWGGNPTTRYNWKINAWNTANDWFFRNVSPGDRPDFTYEEFLKANREHGLQSALTVPMIGWVAKDTSSVSFPASKFGPQEKMDPDVPEAGNGRTSSGRELAPPMPTRTSVPAPPEFIGEWVRAMRKKDVERGRSVQMYFLDNEPMLWNSTHRDVHPEPTTYDELMERTVSYGTAVRQADPEAVIAGPAEWGWTAYFRSAADVAEGRDKDADRKAHGNVPLLTWYLKKLREHEKKTGTRVLDVLDVHFYPQADGVSPDKGEKTDPETAALRIRSTRALWDANYKDESWIGEPVRLIPRLKKMVEENYPGRGIAIGEYNFGAAQHMSGGLAQAEALGRFAEGGVTAAFYFAYPPPRSPAWWAFRAYRNFDGEGGRFQDVYVPSKAEQGTSLFASRSADGRRVVAIALNVEPDTARDARVELKGCGAVKAARVMTYVGEASGFAEQQASSMGSGMVGAKLPPYSITVLDLMLEPSKAPGKPSPGQGRRPGAP
ncbi:glycoside hydrolase family 44 protein [Hyalangium minutum]|uniref:glycoside hydrolase family 44 protein n=1 Tax=Hyalangium minutum TaxID=394096 RepID=UPI0004E631FF|nr:glycoside hydrolase family 44 protein [Hyalangium minutum]